MDPRLVDLTNFICRLTGASQGIGERLAYEFSKYGAVLSLSARKEDQLKKLCDSLNRSGGQAKFYPLDVTKIEQIEAVYKKVSPISCIN
jgi:short-subunit dehydrogenase